MNESNPFPETVSDAGPSEATSALFADLVLRQTQMALLLLGRMPHPESGKSYRNLDQARLAIDQLEMLELKTKGNLTKDEAALLKQSLMTLRMAFVESVAAAPDEAKPGGEKHPSDAGSAQTKPSVKQEAAGTAPPEEESRKKFSKKY